MLRLSALDRQILRLVAEAAGASRAQLARMLRVARSTVSLHVDVLVRERYLREAEIIQEGLGRPATRLVLGPGLGVGVAFAFQRHETATALVSADGTIIDSDLAESLLSGRPSDVLAAAAARARSLLDRQGLEKRDVRYVVASIPAPVDVFEGAASYRAVFPEWANWPLRDRLQDEFSAPAAVDNDANLMALGASGEHGPPSLPLLYLDLSYGVGAGLVVSEGSVYRGADGAAGDIGHLRLASRSDVRCQCGKTGCVATLITIPALMRRVTESQGPLEGGFEELRRLAAKDDFNVVQVIRDVADDVGSLAAALVDSFNPRTLVLGGELVSLNDEVLASVRARVYTDAMAVSTRRLRILPDPSSTMSALRGSAKVCAAELISPHLMS